MSSQKKIKMGEGGRWVFLILSEKMTLDCAYNEWIDKLYKNTAGIS